MSVLVASSSCIAVSSRSRSRLAVASSASRFKRADEICADRGGITSGVSGAWKPSTWTAHEFTRPPRSSVSATPPVLPFKTVTCPSSSHRTTESSPAAPAMTSLSCMCTHVSAPFDAVSPMTSLKYVA